MKNQHFIRILTPEDQQALERFARPLLESSMFLIGNSRAAGLVDQGKRLQGSYAAAFQEEQIIGVVAHFWNQNLVLQAPPALIPDLLHAAASACGRPIRGILGPIAQVQTVLDHLSIGPYDLQMDEPEFLYSLPLADLQVPSPLLDGPWHGRLITVGDLQLMTRWRVGYAVELMNAVESYRLWRDMRKSVQRYLDQEDSWILEDDGRPVATSSFNSRIKEMVQVGGVYTPPKLRGRGYGRGAVAASLLTARAEGVNKAILFTGQDNIPAQKAYQSLGFQIIGDYRITVLKTAVHP